MVSAMRRLTPDESKRIETATAALAGRTHAHFALVIVPVSDRYRLYPVLLAAIVTLVAAGIAAAALPNLPFATGFLGEGAIFVVLSLAFEWLPLRLRLVPRRIKHARAHQLAHLEFAARILAQKDHPHGMLFFVSLGERYVEILADVALHARVGETEWQTIVDRFVTAAKAGALADGFIAAIDSCAAHLERHFPRAG
jgi:putative membrane protein